MNNLSWSKESTSKKITQNKEENKVKKKISFKKEIDDLEKVKLKVEEKYDQVAINKVSNALLEIESAIRNLKSLEYYDL